MSSERQMKTAEEVWEGFRSDIELLFSRQTIRYSKWMLIYTDIFNHCTNDKTGAAAAALYLKFEDFLKDYLNGLCEFATELSDADLVDTYITEWRKYRLSSKILHGMCSYIHRSYGAHNDAIAIYPMAIQMWQQLLPLWLDTQLAQAYLSMIRADRQRQDVNREAIRSLVETYIILDTDDHRLATANPEQTLGTYRLYFEEQFLEDTQAFYRSEAENYLQSHSVREYLVQIPQYIDNDVDRVTFYVHPSTLTKLIESLEEVLIREHLAILCSEAEALLHEGDRQHLNALYRVVSRVEQGTEPLKTIVENFIERIAIEMIGQLEPINDNDLGAYIEAIYNLHQRFSTVCREAFEDDAYFVRILNRTLRRFVNDNAISRTVGDTAQIAECLARYCDTILRAKDNEETNIGDFLPQLKVLLTYIHEQVRFEKYYMRLLAKRLVHHGALSIENEKLMVSCIQDVYSLTSTFQMNQMCRDIETSADMVDRYRLHCQDEQFSAKIQFSVLILHLHAWSFSEAPPVVLPEALTRIIHHFVDFYKCVYTGRRLIWLHHRSKCELQGSFADRPYRFQVSMYEAIVLLLFNTSLTWSVQDIIEQTQINLAVLLQILAVLQQAKILLAIESAGAESLNINSTVKLAENFVSAKHRINLNVPLKDVKAEEQTSIAEDMNKDQPMTVRASIVRTMKEHGTMQESQLVQYVIEKLVSRFSVDTLTVKNCIRILVENEYLERQSDSPDILCYKA